MINYTARPRHTRQLQNETIRTSASGTGGELSQTTILTTLLPNTSSSSSPISTSAMRTFSYSAPSTSSLPPGSSTSSSTSPPTALSTSSSPSSAPTPLQTSSVSTSSSSSSTTSPAITSSTTTAATTMSRPSPPPGARLIPMDLSSPTERTMLRDQRVICGWNQSSVPFWKMSMERGDRTLFWITLPSSSSTSSLPSLQRGPETLCPVGHVSLDKKDKSDALPPDLTLANPDGSVLQITALFVLPEFSSLRLGGFAMDECERLAQEELFGSSKCRGITVTTLSSRYLSGEDTGPHGTGRWALVGQTMPKRDNSVWYARRGYVTYKEEVRCFTAMRDGSELEWFSVFMRKELPDPAALPTVNESVPATIEAALPTTATDEITPIVATIADTSSTDAEAEAETACLAALESFHLTDPAPARIPDRRDSFDLLEPSPESPPENQGSLCAVDEGICVAFEGLRL